MSVTFNNHWIFNIWIAEAAFTHLSLHKVPQSIVISGLTGSGKTEATKQLLTFSCGLKSNHYAEQILNANCLLEAFGNSSTTENTNSSRFIKVVEVLPKFKFNKDYVMYFHSIFVPQISYDSNINIRGIKLDSYLLETNRVCVGTYANYHVFNHLVYGSSKDLRQKLGLDNHFFAVSLKYTVSTPLTIDSFFQVQTLLLLQYVLGAK